MQCADIQADHASSSKGMLQVGGTSEEPARQSSAAGRQGPEQEQQQSLGHSKALKIDQPLAKLHLDACRPASAEGAAGSIHIAKESWLDRATNKARAKIQDSS